MTSDFLHPLHAGIGVLTHGRHRRPPKSRERNFFGAGFNMLVVVILSTALAEPSWIYLRGGGCNMNNLGVGHFFYFGKFVLQEGSTMDNLKPPIVYNYANAKLTIMEDCVTPRVVVIMHTIIALTFIAIISSVVAFGLDLLGPVQPVLKVIRQNALCSIFSVLICVVINGFCYWIAQLVLELQMKTKTHQGNKVEVTFDVSFYLVAAAGALSVVATACNCLRRQVPADSDGHDYLLDDCDDMEIPRGEPTATIQGPPPAYTP